MSLWLVRQIAVYLIYGSGPVLARLEARLPADVHAILKRAAEIQGRTLTDFVVSSACEAACRTIDEADIIRLSLEDQRRFAEAILHPPAPNAALRRAVRRRRKLFACDRPFSP